MKNLTKQKKLDKPDQNLIYGYEGDDCDYDEEGCTVIWTVRCREQYASRCNRCECGY